MIVEWKELFWYIIYKDLTIKIEFSMKMWNKMAALRHSNVHYSFLHQFGQKRQYCFAAL